ncbi:MAG: DUF4959 domain-containing protein [bacterium]|nr:DUF4959 domain-containing protein [bacterium]
MLLVFLFGVTSCNKDKDLDTIPPLAATEITVEALNSAVLLTWTNPSDEDFVLTKITYGEITIEVSKGENKRKIEDLTNGTEYTFDISTVDNAGNVSEPVSVKSTPDKYVSVVQGNDIEDGTFDRLNTTLPIEVTFSNSNCTQTMDAGGTEYIWEGTWSFESDTTYKFDCEYYTIDYRGKVHVADIIKRKTSAFCYEYSDTIFFVEKVFRKIDGEEGFLQGSYRSYMIDNSTDMLSYSDTTFFYANIIEDGNIVYSDSDGNSSTVTWNNQDLLNGDFLFVTYKDETYLITREESYLYNKR